MNYVVAPKGWHFRDPNPFTKANFDSSWSGVYFLDADDKNFINGTGPNDLYCVRFGRRTENLNYRVADFLRYEESNGRTTIIGTGYEFDAQKWIHTAMEQTPAPTEIRSTDPKIIVHSTSREAWESIQRDLMLKSPVQLRQEGIHYTAIGFDELKEPTEYEDYIHFGSIDSWYTEAIVLSQQKGKIVTDEDAPYIPGVRIYLDNHKLIRSGMAIRDGLHLIKVRRKLPLANFLLASISVDVLDPHRSTEEWTPMTFFRKANEYFYRTFPEQNSAVT